jgi:hypothetical protein
MHRDDAQWVGELSAASSRLRNDAFDRDARDARERGALEKEREEARKTKAAYDSLSSWRMGASEDLQTAKEAAVERRGKVAGLCAQVELPQAEAQRLHDVEGQNHELKMKAGEAELAKARPRSVHADLYDCYLAWQRDLAVKLPVLDAIYRWNLHGATGAFAPVARHACQLLSFFGKGHYHLMRYFFGIAARLTVKGWNLVDRQMIGLDEMFHGETSTRCSISR